MSGSLNDHDRTADPVEIRGPDADEAGTDSRRREFASCDPAAERVNADGVDESGLLEGDPFGGGLVPIGCVAGHVGSSRYWFRCRCRGWGGVADDLRGGVAEVGE